MKGLHQRMREHQEDQARQREHDELFKSGDEEKYPGMKSEAHQINIEERRVASASENALIAAQARIKRSTHAEQIEAELENLEKALEQNPNIPAEAIEEYLQSMFNQYFPARHGPDGYTTRYNNAYSARALAQALLPDHRFGRLNVDGQSAIPYRRVA